MPEFINQREQEAEEARDQANAWIARFAPLVLESESLSADEVRERLQLLDELHKEAPETKDRLFMHGTLDDRILRSTLDRAISQLESLETDLRKRLGRISPGDPQSIADLQKINERLEERLARQEIGVDTDVPAILQMRTAPSNWAAAGFLGMFGLGWTSFTAVHAFFMIGGMAKSFGAIAFALLLFYGIFFVVGFGMLAAAVAAASIEEIELNGRELTVHRKLMGWIRSKTYTLHEDCEPKDEVVSTSTTNGTKKTTFAIVLTDKSGKPIHLANGATQWQRDQVRMKLENYLAAHP
jgi:hypothetical protein